ncbi:hypothetical protein SUGI_0649780 [Cryptomeria japonica]|nr:hypothetical protein SUGI_0649780 [Cryptomeria japonica]
MSFIMTTHSSKQYKRITCGKDNIWCKTNTILVLLAHVHKELIPSDALIPPPLVSIAQAPVVLEPFERDNRSSCRAAPHAVGQNNLAVLASKGIVLSNIVVVPPPLLAQIPILNNPCSLLLHLVNLMNNKVKMMFRPEDEDSQERKRQDQEIETERGQNSTYSWS